MKTKMCRAKQECLRSHYQRIKESMPSAVAVEKKYDMLLRACFESPTVHRKINNITKLRTLRQEVFV